MRILDLMILILFCWNTMYAVEPEKEAISSVWIICGYPSDGNKDQKFINTINSIKLSFLNDLGISKESLEVYYFQGNQNFKPCAQENILKACSDISASRRNSLVIFLGHTYSTVEGVNYSLPGPDVRLKEMAHALNKKNSDKKLAVIWACEAGEKATKILGAKNRIILATAETEDRDNEPVLDEVIARVLSPKVSNTDGNNEISFTELHDTAKKLVKEWYEKKGFIQLEKIILDGDGDGVGTIAPAEVDKKPAENIIIHLNK